MTDESTRTPPEPSAAAEAPIRRAPEELERPQAGEPDGLRESVIGQIKTCFDPEIPVNIYELGLIYDVAIDPGGAVRVRMTLTAPNCPAAGTLPGEVESKIRSVPGVSGVDLKVVWEPSWNMAMMSEAARLELGL